MYYKDEKFVTDIANFRENKLCACIDNRRRLTNQKSSVYSSTGYLLSYIIIFMWESVHIIFRYTVYQGWAKYRDFVSTNVTSGSWTSNVISETVHFSNLHVLQIVLCESLLLQDNGEHPSEEKTEEYRSAVCLLVH